jgi:hypothetical protein
MCLLGGKLINEVVQGSLAAQGAIDQFGEEAPVRSRYLLLGQGLVNEQVGIGAFFLNPIKNIESQVAYGRMFQTTSKKRAQG